MSLRTACIVVIAFFALRGAGDAQSPVLRVGSPAAVSGGPVDVPVELDSFADTAGFSFGVCHSAAALQLLGVQLGTALASLGGGTGPEFLSFNPYPGAGFTAGVIVDYAGIEVIPPGAAHELVVAEYLVLAEGSSMVAPCNTLGSPPVALVVSLPGGSTVAPIPVSGVVSGLAPAGTFRRGDLDGDGTKDEVDYALLQEWLFGSTLPFVGPTGPLGCDLQPNQSGDLNDNEVETIADLLMFREWLDCGAIVFPLPSDACGEDPDDGTGGFENPDPDYLVSAFTISITGAVDEVRDVEIYLQVLSPTTVKAVSLGLELGSQLSPAAVPFTVAPGVVANFYDSAFDGTNLLVGAGSTGCATPMLSGGATFQPLGTIHLELAPFAIFPPAQWRSEVIIDGRGRRTTIVDEAFQDHNPFTLAGTFEFARGNSNNLDALVNIADAVYTLGHLFPNPVSLPLDCADAADANNDGRVDIADPIYALAFLFSGGQIIPSPFPECGFDIDLDLLGCDDAICP